MKCKVLRFWVPYELGFDNAVEVLIKLFKGMNIKIDDDCNCSSAGRQISVWIDEKEFDSAFTKMSQHTGNFLFSGEITE